MIVKTVNVNQIVLFPEHGKFLTDGETFSDGAVFLGINDSRYNWYDIDELPQIAYDESNYCLMGLDENEMQIL